MIGFINKKKKEFLIKLISTMSFDNTIKRILKQYENTTISKESYDSNLQVSKRKEDTYKGGK